MSNETEGFHYSFILEEFEDSWSQLLKNFNSERLAMDGLSKCQRHLGDVKKKRLVRAFRNVEPLLKSQGRLSNSQLDSPSLTTKKGQALRAEPSA
jgi:intergrase/recombinase